MAVAVLGLRRDKRGFGGNNLRITLSRLVGFTQQVAVLGFQRDNLRAVTTCIEEGCRRYARQSGAISRFQDRNLIFNRVNLPLKFYRLVLEKPNREGRLIFQIIAVDTKKTGHEALHHVARLCGIGIVEAHVEGDDVARAAFADIASKRPDGRRFAHFFNDRRHRLTTSFAGIKVILLDERDEITAAENFFPNFSDSFADCPTIGIPRYILRQVLRFDKQCRGRAIERRQ